MLASLGHSSCPSCGNQARFQRESLYQGVYYPGGYFRIFFRIFSILFRIFRISFRIFRGSTTQMDKQLPSNKLAQMAIIYSTGNSDAKLQSLKLDQARPPNAKDTMDTIDKKDTNEPKFQKLSFDQPLPPLPKPALIDLAEEEDETAVTFEKKSKNKVVEEEKEEEEMAEFPNPEVKLVELDDHLAVSVNKDEKGNQEIFKVEKTVAIKFGFSNSNRDSGFSSINSEEAFELEVDDDIDVEIEGPEEDKMEMPDKYSEAEESPDEILERYKCINMDFSVALPDEIQSIEYVRDSTITVDLADHLLTEVVEEEDGKNNEVVVEEDGKNEEKHENAAAELGSSLEDSAIDVDTPEKEPTAGDCESEGGDFAKKLVSPNNDQRQIQEKSRQEEKRNLKPKFLKAVAELELEMAEGLKRRAEEEIVSESEKESSAQDFQSERGHRGESQYHREQENILRIAQGFTDEQDNSFTPIKKKDNSFTPIKKKDNFFTPIKKKTKRVSWEDEVQASEKLEREEKDDQPKKRERSRSQDSQEEEEDVSKEDLRRRPKEKSEKRRKSEYKKMRKRDNSQDSQEDEDENETEEEMTIEERKIYEERVRENLRKIKKKPITQREVVHGRNNVSIFNQILDFKYFKLKHKNIESIIFEL